MMANQPRVACWIYSGGVLGLGGGRGGGGGVTVARRGLLFFFFLDACCDRGVPLFFLNTTPQFGSLKTSPPQKNWFLDKNRTATLYGIEKTRGLGG